MFHNHWDLEVISRDMQERRWREAEAARLLVEVGSGSSAGWSDRLAASLTRAAATVRSLLAPAMLVWVARRDPTPIETELARLITRQQRERRVSSRPRRQADPFAGMAVIATGAAATPIQQPCHVADC